MTTLFPSLPTPNLARETALRWEIAYRLCPECNCMLFRHLGLAPLRLGYERCPACMVNFVQRNGVLDIDRSADLMLDELVRRLPTLRAPRDTVDILDAHSGERRASRQPRPVYPEHSPSEVNDHVPPPCPPSAEAAPPVDGASRTS